jgi:hypothetical protein
VAAARAARSEVTMKKRMMIVVVLDMGVEYKGLTDISERAKEWKLRVKERQGLSVQDGSKKRSVGSEAKGKKGKKRRSFAPSGRAGKSNIITDSRVTSSSTHLGRRRH